MTGTSGLDPVTYAESIVLQVMFANVAVRHTRHHNPGAYPEWGQATGPVALATRIVGALLEEGLLDAGWTMPDTPGKETP